MKAIEWALGFFMFITFCLAQALVSANDELAEVNRQFNSCINGEMIGKNSEAWLVCKGVEEIKTVQLICPVKGACNG
jgi:hypothetical protein